jgi:hypothetical protein
MAVPRPSHRPLATTASLVRRPSIPERPLQRKFEKILHEFKREAYKIEHGKATAEQITKECTSIADEVLSQKYNYHFHKLPDANRAEIINMINNYTREAILPPVVERLVQRQLMLERKQNEIVVLIERMLEVLSEEPAKAK